LLIALALGGCAAPLARIATHGPLEGVPFHPQELHQCGPAALATILGAAGVEADPASLAGQVYVPERGGSFQAELIAATRRASRVPYLVDGTLEALAAEIAAGRPVLVLQNLALPSLPRWHYAVVIGIDAGHVTLRSGRRAAQRLSHRNFLRSWNWAYRWGFVALRTGEWPARPDPRRWLATYSDLEQVGRPDLAAAGYADAVARWPAEPMAWFALGNVRYRAGRLPEARTAFAQATNLDAGFVAGWNNLAQVLGELGCREAASIAIERGLRLADDGQRRLLEATARGLPDAAAAQPVSSTASACSSASGNP